MIKHLSNVVLSVALTALAIQAKAGCDIGLEAHVKILANEFPAIQGIMKEAKTCNQGSVTVTANMTKQLPQLSIPSLSAKPAAYSVVQVANATIVGHLSKGLIRPLDDLVKKHGQSLQPNQLIKIDGKIVAIAFLANTQHFYYRSDILQQAGLEVPKSYEDVVKSGQVIRDKGIMQYPVMLNTATGWNLAQEFINLYMGTGAPLFKPGTVELDINNQHGLSTLSMLKKLTELSHPDYLTFDSNTTSARWKAGEAALANLWGSRASSILDNQNPNSAVVTSTKLSSAPVFYDGHVAATLWWDGFAIAKHIPDDEAEAAFLVMMRAIDEESIKKNNDKAVWLSKAYTPREASVGVYQTAKAGAKPYPMLPQMSILHQVLGSELSDYLLGKESAEQVLKDIDAAYKTAAKEKGFLE